MCQESVHFWAAKGVRIFCHLSPLAKAVPGALQQRARFEDGQADHARMAAGEVADKGLGLALDGIAACLAHAFAAGDVPVDLGLVQPLEGDDRVRDAGACLAVGADQADGGQAMVAPAREQGEHAAQIRLVLGLGEDATADRDGGVAREH
ncbi:hypothetical protein ACS72_00610 [Acinetobacter sp. VT 511]|nr:hypothetical protein ACS72_00610 [Acinetobacter sp. VT 511]